MRGGNRRRWRGRYSRRKDRGQRSWETVKSLRRRYLDGGKERTGTRCARYIWPARRFSRRWPRAHVYLRARRVLQSPPPWCDGFRGERGIALIDRRSCESTSCEIRARGDYAFMSECIELLRRYYCSNGVGIAFSKE